MRDHEQEFKLGEAAFVQMRRAAMFRVLPIMTLAAGAGGFVGRQRTEVSTGLMVMVSALLLAILGVSMWRGFRLQVRRLQSYRIAISPVGISCTQDGVQDVIIPAAAITRVTELSGKRLTVYGQTSRQVIAIPASVDGFDDVRQALASWHHIEPVEESALSRAGSTIAGVATIAAFVLVFASDSPALVTSVGIAFIAALSWGVVATVRSPHVDSRFKRRMWVLILPAASVVARIWSMWQPYGD